MHELGLRQMTLLTTWWATTRQRLIDQSGEGVISAAIAVLIFAFLGAAMWVGFNEIWGDAQSRTAEQVLEIGS